MAYYAYGWPKALVTGCSINNDKEILYAEGTGDYLVIVTAHTIQIWNAGQHRIKLGELARDQASIAEEGVNTMAQWCNNRRILAVVTQYNHLHFYGLHTGREVAWQSHTGFEIRKVSIYLQNDIDLKELGVNSIADLSGDGKTLVLATHSGDLLSLSWQGKPRGTFNPLIQDRRRPSVSSTTSTTAAGVGSSSRETSEVYEALAAANFPDSAVDLHKKDSLSVTGLVVNPSVTFHQSSIPENSLLVPSPSLPTTTSTSASGQAATAIHRIQYLPSSRLLTEITEDGSCALLRASEAGLDPIEAARFLRWVHKPSLSPLGKAVSAAVQPGGQLLALGLASGAVALYSIPTLLKTSGGVSRSNSRRADSISGPGSSFGLETAPSLGGGGGVPASSLSSSSPLMPEPLRVLSLTEWGHTSEVLGAANLLKWSPDGAVIAVGYRRRGLAVWTPSGCRLMSSLRQAVQAPFGAPRGPLSPLPPVERGEDDDEMDGGGLGKVDRAVLEGGISALTWTPHGYSLLAAERFAPGLVYELRFARSLRHNHRVSETTSAETATASRTPFSLDIPTATTSGATPSASTIGPSGVHVMLAEDRLLLITDSPNFAPRSAAATGAIDPDTSTAVRPELTLQHIRAPPQYIDGAYPLQTAALSADGRDIAVAGSRGLALYGVKTARWRLFGDAMQERRIRVNALGWLPGSIVVVAAGLQEDGRGKAPGQGLTQQLMLFPKHHLDLEAVLARQWLGQAPLAMDVHDSHIVLAFNPLEIKILRADRVSDIGGGGGNTLSSAGSNASLSSMRRGGGSGGVGASGSSGGQQVSIVLTAIRELSILSVGPPLKEIVLLPTPFPGVTSSSSTRDAYTTLTSNLVETPNTATRRSAYQQQSIVGAVFKPSEAAAAAADTTGGQEGDTTTTGLAALRIDAGQKVSSSSSSLLSSSDGGPTRCVILRSGGVMSVLDLDQGSEMLLAEGIEAFWLPASGQTTTNITAGFHASPSLDDTAAAVSLNSPLHPGSARHRPWTPFSVDDGGAARSLELPWWTYGARGMQLWFPSTLSDPLSPKAREAAASAMHGIDPELEFDPEVYPVGVSMSEVSIIGIMQRVSRNPSFPATSPSALCFHPLPESQPVLPCLLRRLLEQDRFPDALELASRHSQGPHFARSLEWLLFTTLEADAESGSGGGGGNGGQSSAARSGGRKQRFSSSYSATLASLPDATTPKSAGPAGKRLARAGPLLLAAARLLRQFVQCPEVVVSVARKTDAQMWPALFAAVGSPTALCEELMRNGALQSAACSLLLVDHVEGASQAHGLALRLLRAALTAGSFDLAADLLRFVVPPGEENELHAVLAGGGGGGSIGPGAFAPGAVGRSSSVMNLNASFHDQMMAVAGTPRTPPSLTTTGGLGGGGVHSTPLLQQPQQQRRQQQQDVVGGEQQQQSQQQQQGIGSWLWSVIAGPAPPVNSSNATASSNTTGGGNGGGVLDRRPVFGATDEPFLALTPATDAWRMVGRHAWKLLDSGALRELAALGKSTASLPGGLASLLSSSAPQVNIARTHTTASAAAIASALFVAINEFASVDVDAEVSDSATELLYTLAAAGCINHATAMALVLGRHDYSGEVEDKYPVMWEELHALIANDVHLCAFVPLMSPPSTPLMLVTPA